LKGDPNNLLEKKDIFLLNAFLTGYLCNDAIRLGEKAVYDFRSDFNNWLQNKYNYHNPFSWSNIINEISIKEKLNSVDVFFREYHLFNQEK